MPIVLKSGSVNLLEPLGPVQACNGIALPLPALPMLLEIHWKPLWVLYALYRQTDRQTDRQTAVEITNVTLCTTLIL